MGNMELLIWLLKKYYTNRKAYALNEYRHYEQKDSKTYESYWTIEPVLIKSIFIDADHKTEYSVKNLKTGEDWGDYTEHVYLTKYKAAEALMEL